MYLDTDFLKKNHEMIHFFGLGFVQIKLDFNIRMHFYHPNIAPIVHVEEIHNHRYDFISTILAGKLTQETFTIQTGISDYIMVEENCKKEKIEKPQILDVIVIPDSVHHFRKGDSYTCLSNQFHRVSTDFAISRLYRGDIILENASVIKSKQGETVCPFSQQLSIDECWEIVDSCITIAKATI